METDIENIAKILGDDILTMGEKNRLIETIKDTNNNKKVLKKWIALEKAKMVYDSDIEYARREGAETSKLEVIKNMLDKRLDYSVISDVTGKTIEEIESDMKKEDK